MKRNKKRKNISSLISKLILSLVIILIIIFFGFFFYIYLNSPEFNTDNLYKRESTNIFDSNGNLIATIGSEKRQLAVFEELPQVLIDAIVSTEDARFFDHNGFDIYRFAKAGSSFIKGEDGGGASTLTMQISKNAFTSNENKGIDGIIRKFTDIYMSIFRIEKNYSKKEIIEFYVNSPYLGASSYGVKMAARKYFNKDISDLNLVQAAMIAGLFQAPGEYDPYINPDKTNKRKNEVLGLMLRHGYIKQKEYESAKNIDIKNIIIKQNQNINKYQGFIDAVVEEVINKTGNNPYNVSMDIYTTMVKSKQDIINNFYQNHKFKDNKVQVGIAAIDNDTGEIIALGAGRNKQSEMSLNYATQIKRHPGSTAKPLFDYAPGIEYNNWSTYTPFIDKPVKYTNGGYMRNVDGRYKGFMTLKSCLVESRNTCALQAFQKLNNSKIDKFVNSLGITPEYIYDDRYINEAHSIGAFTGVSPLELASAYSAFGNEGKYVVPHSVRKIIYKNNKEEEEIVFNYEPKRVMKEQTAYMISNMLLDVTSYSVKVAGTQIATKTGTSSYDENLLRKMGLSNSVVQDVWTVTFSPDYSIAIWYGYDSLTKKTYNTTSHAWNERIKIQKEIVNKMLEKNSKFKVPKGIISSKVVVGSNPPKLPSYNTPASKIQTHLFLKGTQPTQIISYPKTNNDENKTNNESKTNNDSSLPNILNP